MELILGGCIHVDEWVATWCYSNIYWMTRVAGVDGNASLSDADVCLGLSGGYSDASVTNTNIDAAASGLSFPSIDVYSSLSYCN